MGLEEKASSSEGSSSEMSPSELYLKKYEKSISDLGYTLEVNMPELFWLPNLSKGDPLPPTLLFCVKYDSSLEQDEVIKKVSEVIPETYNHGDKVYNIGIVYKSWPAVPLTSGRASQVPYNQGSPGKLLGFSDDDTVKIPIDHDSATERLRQFFKKGFKRK